MVQEFRAAAPLEECGSTKGGGRARSWVRVGGSTRATQTEAAAQARRMGAGGRHHSHRQYREGGRVLEKACERAKPMAIRRGSLLRAMRLRNGG